MPSGGKASSSENNSSPTTPTDSPEREQREKDAKASQELSSQLHEAEEDSVTEEEEEEEEEEKEQVNSGFHLPKAGKKMAPWGVATFKFLTVASLMMGADLALRCPCNPPLSCHMNEFLVYTLAPALCTVICNAVF